MVDSILLSDIHAHFRRLRNGEVADNLLAQGIRYRLAWGLESYRLKDIAALYTPDAELAETLWKEDVRESKMLATRLYPVGQMTPETAERWSREIPYAEIADQACMNLFARLPFARQLALGWLKGSPMQQYCALQLQLRLEFAEPEFRKKAQEIMADYSQPAWLRAAALRIEHETGRDTPTA
ncbi:MAG: DNA alkylation repair protein [Bacteroidales bacterium]|nr:DNA alkylation repair protein [Bacteroidales bacterium]